MRIDKRLNLVVPIEGDSGTTYVHSTPISRETFEKYVFPISKTLSVLYGEGLTVFAGPRVAALMLKQVSQTAGMWEGDEGVNNGLLTEIRRLSNVVLMGESGWETVPYQDAVSKGRLDADDIAEVEGQIVFFTCISCIHRKREIPLLLDGVAEVWSTQSTSLNVTEWANSLPISTADASSGAMATPSSIPS